MSPPLSSWIPQLVGCILSSVLLFLSPIETALNSEADCLQLPVQQLPFYSHISSISWSVSFLPRIYNNICMTSLHWTVLQVKVDRVSPYNIAWMLLNSRCWHDKEQSTKNANIIDLFKDLHDIHEYWSNSFLPYRRAGQMWRLYSVHPATFWCKHRNGGVVLAHCGWLSLQEVASGSESAQ